MRHASPRCNPWHIDHPRWRGHISERRRRDQRTSAACVGDAVSCPLHGAGVITHGGVGTINGRQIAHHGSGTSCGATLVVSDDGPTV
ncbi:PAAR domain-containing protein [Burkholderia multivorans]|uniref:PAAR domain-containing protein n=1 Tax=Burkholderia multivorans TaxID=87883 RepID=UPI0020B3F09B|nr:PAAR domain-containing protein [Burkholderia multivorans]